MKFNIETLNQYKKDGWLYNQSHPVHPLLIWNYSIKTQYEGFWDGITLQARGLVTDLDGNVVAKGFPKFFNIEENRHIPTDDFEVFEKLDGQLILVFWYKYEMIVASRGSFTSKYAKEAKRILDEKYPEFEKTTKQNSYQTTYCFELIGFEQIVVSYPEPDLILTGCFYKSKYEGWNDSNIYDICKRPFNDWPKLVKKYSGLDWKNVKQLNWKNSEGFVVRFGNGQRCKIKFEDYIKLHRQMTNLSTTAIWEALKEGKPVSTILNDVPDEFYSKVHEYENELKERFNHINTGVIAYFNYFKPLLQYRRKLFAERIIKLLVEPYKSSVLAMIDNKNYDELIWEFIKPKFEKI